LAEGTAALNEALARQSEWWVVGLRMLWMTLLTIVSLGISIMLARAIHGITAGRPAQVGNTTGATDAVA
jgi:hypothetical protein